MIDIRRIIAFALAGILLILSPYLPSGVPGLLVMVAGAVHWYKGKDLLLCLALGIIGLLGLIGIIPIFILCASIMIVATTEMIFSFMEGKMLEYALSFTGALFIAAIVMEYLSYHPWLSAVVGATVAVLIHSILGKHKDIFAIELAFVTGVMVLLMVLGYQATFSLVLTAAVVAFGFSYFAYRLRTADIPGLFSAALVGIILIVFAGISWFLIMLAFFVLGAIATRYKMDYKKTLHVEEEKGGVRGYINVFANGLVSVISAIGFGVTQHPFFIATYVGSVSTAAADTIAGEIGVCYGRPLLITTFKPVPEGTNGGVSVIGEFAGFIGAFLVSACAYLLNTADITIFAAAVVGGFIGTNLDSLIGELFENKKYFGNAGTNFLATLGGGVVTALIWVILVHL